MKTISLDFSKASQFVKDSTLAEMQNKAVEAQKTLEAGTCPGNDFLGWLHLPSSISKADLQAIKDCAATLRKECDTIVVAGIGGSYLGARAVIESLSNTLSWLVNDKKNPTVLFAGNSISEDYLFELTEYLKDKKFGVINISKSGTTTETALTFRLLKKQCEDQRGKEVARKVIVAITDAHKGAARTTADKEGYTSFVIPDNVGGRFSVLTPVGLLPIACAGFDVDELVAGACDIEKAAAADVPFEQNICLQYAAVRNALYSEGKKIEILADFQPKLHFMAEWWKQLYGESEGKDNKGIFPTAANFSTDLHSIGQFIQDGTRSLFETVVWVKNPRSELVIEAADEDIDGLNYLAGKSVQFVDSKAYQGTLLAHMDGGTPNIIIEIDEADAYHFAYLVYFFEKACGLSGYLLGVNPFDQPGVEAYKKNMFALLGKPGYEARRAELEERMK